MGYSKRGAAAIVINSAMQYKSELLNRTLLFVSTDKHKNIRTFEVTFRERNYMHLTGLVPVEFIDHNGESHILSANEFFNKCITKTLQTNQFEFHKDGTTQLKLTVLPKMICKNLSATMIGDYDTFTPKLKTDKLVGKTSGIMGFTKDNIEHKFLPNTLLNADIRDLSTSTLRIIATFRKNATDEEYKELTYKAKKVEWDRIKFPEEIEYLKSFVTE
ncbi:MAG: PBECR4 domain-containing protein [Acutalibacteraceae bacterium]